MPTPSPTPGPDDEAELGIGSTMISEKDGMTLVYVPEGKFKMGGEYDDEKPIHTVYLDAFWIDQTEVTNAMYEMCVEAGACKYPSNEAYYVSERYSDHPVIYVNWNRANAYCEWAGRRLPTEAEWEKAARGMDGRTYPWGENIDSNLANYNKNIGDTTEVGSYLDGASPYGALDMAGNVWEWVADWYGENHYSSSPFANPTGPSTGVYRVLRGGSWYSQVKLIRPVNRQRRPPSLAHNRGGFRCATSD